MRHSVSALSLLFTWLVLTPMLVRAQSAEAPPAKTQPANEQVIVPQVERRPVKLPRFPSKDFEVGVFGGVYSTQNFGSSPVGGLRVGYHVTEDIFVQAVYARTTITDEAFRQILPSGVFAQEKETLSYYNLSAGYNLLPGEVFFGRNHAWASALYVVGGIGSTKFVNVGQGSNKIDQQNRQTVNYGLGLRVLFWQRLSVQVDLRDHLFSLDLLGKRQNTHNLELTGGLNFYF